MLDVQNRLPTPGKENRVKITQDSGAVVEGVLSYADEAMQDGTFWNRKNGQLLQGDIREYPVRDGESIVAGDVVNVDGDVYRDVTSQANVENVIYNTAVTNTHLASFGEKAYLCVDYGITSKNVQLSRLNDSYSANKASVMLANGVSTAQSYGLQAMGAKSISVSFESNGSHYVRFYAYSESSGSFTQTKSYSVSNAGPLCRLSDNSVLHIRNTSGLMVEVISTSQKYSETKLLNNTGANYISACKLPDDSNGNKRVCICFADTGDGNKGKAVIATIDSSNTVTFGNVVTIKDEAATSGNSIACDSKRIFLSVSGKGYTTNLDLSNVVYLSLNTYTVLNISENVFANIAPPPGTISTPCPARIVYFSGNDFQIGNSFQYSQSAAYMSASLVSKNKILLAYSDKNNSSYGTTTILEVLGNQIAGSFLDESKDAIALASGSGGDIIPVGFGGYCQCDGVTEGQEIISGGVSAFSPLDGWLYLLGEGMKRLGTQIQIVSYVGTGTYGVNNPCSITADFQISIAIYLGYDRGSGIMDGFPDGGPVMIPSIISTEYKNGAGFRQGYGKKSSDSHTLYWYNYADAMTQLNYSKYKYYFLILG